MLKQPLVTVALLMSFAPPLAAQNVNFGDDSGQFTQDGECDDRRFFGPGSAKDIDSQHIGRDAADCRQAFEAGTILLWNPSEAKAATSCETINFGDDGSEYANDLTCDDPRFEGIGSALTLLDADRGRDASDCRQLCEMGALYIRNHGTY